VPIERYTTPAIWLHWLIALLIICAFILGLTVDAFPKSWDGAIVNLHVLLGLGVLVLSIARIWWRLSHRPPLLPEGTSALTRQASLVGHSLLYIMMVAVPLIGLPTLLYRGRGIDLGLFQIASPFARDPQIFRPLTENHEIAAYALVLLAVGHAIAAVYHHVILKDRLLLRMMRSRSA
jgi:cytochrome b561